MSAPSDRLSEFVSSRHINENSVTEEFPGLKGIVYVDHAASTLVSKTQLDKHRDDILQNVYGNPHSHSPSSQLATDTIDQVRYSILKFFNTTFEDYTVIFTAGCTASLKLLGESFNFHGNHDSQNLSENSQNICVYKDETSVDKGQSLKCDTDGKKDRTTNDGKHKIDEDVGEVNAKGDDGTPCYGLKDNKECQECSIKNDQNLRNDCVHKGSFTYLLDDHTSVQGMRELAFQRAGKVQCIDCDEHFNFIPSSQQILMQSSCYTGRGNHLFVYPAQSNFNGTKYPLDWVTKVKDVCFQWQHEGIVRDEGSTRAAGGWFVCLDAASLVSTSPLNLDKVKPDFVTLSFYKMFGYPTGLGALIVKNTAIDVLQKTYFGGGTVAVSLPCKRFHVSRSSLSERFEDGTLPYLDIIALKHGFDVLTALAGGISRISHHTFTLAQYFHHNLSSCLHENGSPLAILYCVGDYSNIQTQGGIVNFNLLRPSGEFVGFAEVDKLAHLFNIHLRTGCFCNIGACQKFLNLSDDQIKNNFETGHVCGDNNDLIEGRPTGSVRISFGYMSTLQDAKKCLQFIVDCFLENSSKPVFWKNQTESQSIKEKNVDVNSSSCPLVRNPTEMQEKSDDPDLESLLKRNKMSLSSSHRCHDDPEFHTCHHKQLKQICLYPVKSCGALKVNKWQLGPRGLVYDREWMVVTESGIAMSQKREKNLCLIKPYIDLEKETLTLTYPGDLTAHADCLLAPLQVASDSLIWVLGLSQMQCTMSCIVSTEILCYHGSGMDPVTISMRYVDQCDVNSYMCNSKVCGDRVQSLDCGQEVADWLSQALQRPGCRLLRQKLDDARISKLVVQGESGVEKSQLSLANEGQYLLISRDSVRALQEQILTQFNEHFDLENLEERFRANLIVSGCEPFEEDSWLDVQIGVVALKSQGVCTRCQMVCLDQQTGDRNKSPLQALTTWTNRKTSFGVLLCSDISHNTPVKQTTIGVGDPVFV